MKTSALPLSPLTRRELRERLTWAEREVASRAVEVAAGVDRSQQRPSSYAVGWILDAGREFAVLDAALTARFADVAVPA